MDHFLKLEDHNSLPNSASPDTDDWHLHLASQSASRLRSSAPTGRRSCGRGDKEWPGLAAKVPVSKAKRNDKTTRRPQAQTPSSESTASPKRPKAINQALEKPHPAPTRWRETHDALKVTRPRFPALADTVTMGRDVTPTWPSGRRWILWCATPLSLARAPEFLINSVLSLNALYRPSSSLFFAFDESIMSKSRRSFRLCSRRKPRMTGAVMYSLCTSLGGKLSSEALLAAREHVIADALVNFWRCKTQFVPTPPSRPLRN